MAKESDKRVDTIVPSGGVEERQESGLVHICKIFFTGDLKEVKRWAIEEEALPWFKRTLIGVINRFTLNGGGYSQPSPTGSSNIAYEKSYISGNPTPVAQTPAKREYGPKDTGQIVIKPDEFRTGFDIAKQVLDILNELIMGEYKQARVMDYYQALGVTGNYECMNWGWTNLAKAQIIPLGHDQAWISMPDPVNLRK